MEKTKIDKLDEKIKQLQKRKKQIQAKDMTQATKGRDQKILIGGTIISAIKNNKIQWYTTKVLLDENLVRDNDRALFDLPKKSS